MLHWYNAIPTAQRKVATPFPVNCAVINIMTSLHHVLLLNFILSNNPFNSHIQEGCMTVDI